MFGFGTVCDRLLGEVVPEEYMWLADLGCASLDVATGNFGNAASLAVKAAQDGAAAAGNKDVAQKIGIANTAQGIITIDPLNHVANGEFCTDDTALMLCKMSDGQKAAIRASAVAGGMGIGAAKGGKMQDYQEGLAIGGAASNLAIAPTAVKIDPRGDVKTLMGNASLLGRSTTALATSVAVASQNSQADKRKIGAVGSLAGAAIDLPSAVVDLGSAKNGVEAMLATEKIIQDAGSIAFNTCKARLQASDRGKDLTKAANIFENSTEIIKGATGEVRKTK